MQKQQIAMNESLETAVRDRDHNGKLSAVQRNKAEHYKRKYLRLVDLVNELEMELNEKAN